MRREGKVELGANPTVKTVVFFKVANLVKEHVFSVSCSVCSIWFGPSLRADAVL
jgi:hypothetical protein